MKLVVAVLLLCVGLCCAQVQLRQSDFDQGTVQLTEPGTYVLAEDIVFNPSSVSALGVDAYHAGDVQPHQYTFAGGEYDPAAFGIGFFAAIAISGDGITLDLNGHTLEQDPEHSLQQMFYSHIELADRPFVPTEGPHNFGSSIKPATNVVVKNGVLGNSSHHGIHGNGAINVTITNLVIEKFEVAAIALNGVQGASLTDLTIRDTRRTVATLGTWSSARFIRRFLEYLVDTGSSTTLRVQGVEYTATEIRDSLATAMNNVFDDVITKGRGFIDPEEHPDEYTVFHNAAGMLDGGTAYGLLLNQLGVAILGFPWDEDISQPAERVLIENVTIENLAFSPNEMVVLSNGEGEIVIDPVGAAFQLRRPSPLDGSPVTMTSFDDNVAEYKGSVIANAQALVGKAIKNGDFDNAPMDASMSIFPQELLDWIEATPGTEAAKLAPVVELYPWVCNGDAMFHVNKGYVGMKMDASEQTTIRNVHIRGMQNLNPVLGSDVCDYTSTTFSHPDATMPGFQANVVRGFSIAGSFDLVIDNATVEDLTSTSGSVFGFDILTDAHMITCNDCSVSNLSAGLAHDAEEYIDNPTELPRAVGFRIDEDARDIMLSQYSVEELVALGSTAKLDSEGTDVFAEEAVEASSSSGSSGSSPSSGSGSGSGSSSSTGAVATASLALTALAAALAL
mmetsp:Transcript_8184/g.34380  ORF Transcript_8184/g.34380 Transcript_8184/m.34380 type:complete len:676 (+) Transcript_8184:38-2065(+)